MFGLSSWAGRGARGVGVRLALAALVLGSGACAPGETPQDLATASAPRQLDPSPSKTATSTARQRAAARAEQRWWRDVNAPGAGADDLAGGANRLGWASARAIDAYITTRDASDLRLLDDTCGKLAEAASDMRAYHPSPDQPTQRGWQALVDEFVAAGDECANGTQRRDARLLGQAKTRLDAAFTQSKRLAHQVSQVIATSGDG